MAKPFVPPRTGGAAFSIVDLGNGSWTKMNALWYGQPGVGKTTLAASAAFVPQMSPVLIIDNSGGTRTLQGRPEYAGKVQVIRITYFEGYNEAYAYITQNITKYKTIIIDDLGMAWQQAMDFEMERVVASDSSREIGVPSQREYGIVRNMIHKLVRYFIGLPHNLLITAHADWDKDDLTQLQKIRPALPGKLAYEVPGLMNVVGFMAMKKRQKGGPINQASKEATPAPDNTGSDFDRIVYYVPRNYEVKDTSDKLGSELVNPTMAQIAGMIGLEEPDFESFYATANNLKPKIVTQSGAASVKRAA